MSRICVIGAGQDGLFLAHKLLDQGHEVTVFSGQTSTEIRTGRSSVTAPTWPHVWEMEQQAGLDRWSSQGAPRYSRVDLRLRVPQQPEMVLSGNLDGVGTAIERRVKMGDWLEHFEDKGGKVVIQNLDHGALYYFGSRGMYDLMILAVGSGQLGALFDPDDTRSSGAFNRVMTQAILDDVEWPQGPDYFDAISTPEGEVFMTPVLTPQGPATSLFATAMPGKGLDCQVDGRPTQTALFEALMAGLKRAVPDVYDRCRNAQPVDAHALLQEEVRPMVRKPVAELPQGGLALGMADSVVATDPVSTQQAALATGYAQTFADAIAERPEGPFDAAWMREVDAKAWHSQGQYSSVLANMVSGFWVGQMPAHFPTDLLPAAMRYQELQDWWIQGIAQPQLLDARMFDADRCRQFIAEVAGRA